MALAYTFTTSATLTGARNVNKVSRTFAQDDVGGKLEKAISAINDLQSAVSTLNVAVSNIHIALLSGMTDTPIGVSGIFSALSGAGGFTSGGSTISTTGALSVTALSNFRS
jgi:hypothetical protein